MPGRNDPAIRDYKDSAASKLAGENTELPEAPRARYNPWLGLLFK